MSNKNLYKIHNTFLECTTIYPNFGHQICQKTKGFINDPLSLIFGLQIYQNTGGFIKTKSIQTNTKPIQKQKVSKQPIEKPNLTMLFFIHGLIMVFVSYLTKEFM